MSACSHRNAKGWTLFWEWLLLFNWGFSQGHLLSSVLFNLPESPSLPGAQHSLPYLMNEVWPTDWSSHWLGSTKQRMPLWSWHMPTVSSLPVSSSILFSGARVKSQTGPLSHTSVLCSPCYLAMIFWFSSFSHNQSAKLVLEIQAVEKNLIFFIT